MKDFMRKYRPSVISGLLVIAVAIIAVLLHLFSGKDAPFQILAACLGAAVTVVITNILLVQQSNQQQNLQNQAYSFQQKLQDDASAFQLKIQNDAKEKEFEQILEKERYRKKMEVYQEYIEYLSKVFEDKELSEDEKIIIQFKTANLATHTTPEHIEKISACMKDIITSFDKERGYDVKTLQRSLITIVQQFREELYPNGQKYGNDYSNTIENFSEAFDGDKESNETNRDEEINEIENTNIRLWNEAVKRWTEDTKNNWEKESREDSFLLYHKENKDIHVQIGFWQGHYYIQAKYHRFTQFAKELKWKYKKGTRQYETWWKGINEIGGFPELKEGTLWKEMEKSDELQLKFIKWVEELKTIIEKWDIGVYRYDALVGKINKDEYNKRGWKFWVWNATRLVCDSQKEDYGEPFIDTYKKDDENGKYVVEFGNRYGNIEMQKKILQHIGLGEDMIREDGRTTHAEFDGNTSFDVIIEKLIELIEKIDKLQ